MKAKVYITLKPGLLDAQGKTVKNALESLGFDGVKDVRIGKYVEIELNGTRAASAKQAVERMCQRLLANPVVETYHIELAQGFGLRGRGQHDGSPARRPQPRARRR